MTIFPSATTERRTLLPHLTAFALMGVTSGLTVFIPRATASETVAQPIPDRVTFNEHVRPLFAKHCVSCHGGVKQAGGLSLIYREQAVAPCNSGESPIVPGDAAQSYLIERIRDADPDSRMPPGDHGPPLDPRQIELLTRWIDQGAKWEQQWSFTPPQAAAIPTVGREHWPRDPLDSFILARLESAGLTPAVEATRAQWLRRASLDLTGLPPSAEEYADFELDHRSDAYERVVDRLLSSPRYGERWASMWLDLARYADSAGFEKDPHRTIWPYRDWLIRALNDDMPFDEFTIKQLAGDLLPDARFDDRIATAFHRNTQLNTEGGTDDEEYRMAAVLDRVGTTWQVWQASTFGCTQCHAHPYEPFRHDEFYRFVAFFNTSRDADLTDDSPVLSVPDDAAQWELAERLDKTIAELREQLFSLTQPLATDASRWKFMTPLAATATGQATMTIRRTSKRQIPEVRADGTISANSIFTLEFDLDGVERITALRIDALPKQLAAALKIPEHGFVLSKLQGEFVTADGQAISPLDFAAAFSDEAVPQFDPAESFRDGPAGWGDFSRMSHPRYAVFVLRQAAEVPPGARLRLTLAFHQSDSGGGGLVIARGRYSVSSSDDWIPFVSDSQFSELHLKLSETLKQRAAIAGVALPIMAEQSPQFARRTYTFGRGNWLDRETEVTPGVPAIMPPLPAGVPHDRLAMARWLASSENPLTARVMVNRLWQELFGIGIVETSEDFGTSGELPTHPELLDHLALRFQSEHGWSVKQMLRDLVLSAAYRQAGVASSEKLILDPRNRLVSRGPRTRLSAEMVRDQALQLSGRLSPEMYGKPVMPPQPDGVWRSVYNGEIWAAAEGKDRYRRAIYTYWKRTSGYPSLTTFDVPSRDICVVRRIATNTPLQALVTLNDPAFIELAQGFAERMAAIADEPSQQIAAGYRLATGRAIQSQKLGRLRELYDEAVTAYQSDPPAAQPLAATPEAYGLTVVANALLNLDDFLTK